MPVGTHYGDTSVKEDVMQVIFQITPEDTPFYNMIGDSTANSPKHEWQIRSLTTRSDNAVVEGASYTFAAPVLPTRVNNFTQIIQKTARVSGTSQATSRHAISNLVADQIEQRMVEWKTDTEHALLRGSNASGNASDTARRMDGLLNAVSTNATAFASGITLGETELNDLLETVWNAGGKPRDALVHGFLKRRISSFSGNAAKRFDQNDREIVNTIAIYESDFSTVSVQLSRDMLSGTNANACVVLDRDMFSKAWLRSPSTRRVAETADSIDTVIMGECTLEYGNEAAAGLITAAS
jgi:hypothetical protein